MYLLLTYRCRSRIIALKARTVLFKVREYAEGNARAARLRRIIGGESADEMPMPIAIVADLARFYDREF